MGMTIAEKIIAAAAGVESVKPGDIHTVELDCLMSNDGTTHLTVDMYNNKLKNPHIAKCDTVTDCQSLRALSGKFHHLIVTSVGSDFTDDGEDQISRIYTFRQLSNQVEFHSLRYHYPGSSCYHTVKEVCTSNTGSECTKCTVRTGMAV